jgi:hypothetical protein
MIASKPTLEIYRDCFKLVHRMAADQPAKLAAARILLRREFDRNRFESDNARIQELRDRAVKGITNYLIHTIKAEMIDQ